MSSSWWRAKVVEVFGADLRSLALFRMVLALLVLADLANRATDLYAHYTDAGVLPRSVLQQEVLNRWSFSLNLMNGELYFQILVFGFGALAALALLAGYHTRLMSVAVWVVLLSIQYRNPLVLTAGDTLLRMLLFWGMFLPLGAYWSVDRVLKSPPRTAPVRLSMQFLSLATVALFMQIAFMYWFTEIQKSGREWRVDGTAIYYALSLDQTTTPLGAYLLNFPTLLEVLTFATIAFELVGPFLLFCPFLTGPVRTGAVLGFMGFHSGIWLTMEIGFFPWIAALCMVCFLPGWFWEESVKLRPALLSENPNIMGHLKQRATRLLAHASRLPFRAGSSSLGGVGRPSMVGLSARGGEDDQPEGPGPRAAIPPRADTTMRQSETGPVAEAGQEMRHADTAGPTVLRSSLVTDLLAIIFLLYVLLWNLTTVSSFTMPERLVPLGHILGLKQDWSMFAPYPAKNDGWYVIPGTLGGGQQVDLMGFIRGEPSLRVGVSWEKPQYVTDTFKNEHWRKYLNNIRDEDRADLPRYFGRYVCREWNATHEGAQRLESLQIAFMKEKTLPDYQRSTPQKTVLPEHRCS